MKRRNNILRVYLDSRTNEPSIPILKETFAPAQLDGELHKAVAIFFVPSILYGVR